MTSGKMPRAMWLLNHTTLREFDLEQLAALGVTEVFTPKSFLYDEGNLSATVDHATDRTLTIPAQDLALLNAQDWYGEPSQEAWDIANRHFQIAIMGFFPRQLMAAARFFEGSVVLRAFGLAKGHSYTQALADATGPHAMEALKRLGGRFWFGASYEHLAEVEGPFLKSRLCFLPLGLGGGAAVRDGWTGEKKKILFVCPRIGTSPYYKAIYDRFVEDFQGMDCIIGGAQPVPVPDPKVMGFVPRAAHEANMRDAAVMYYHSTEPNHIHYHPFEAVRAGMPLVFLAGGMLDRLGGMGQPGRCADIAEARRKIERILKGDKKLSEAIRRTQPHMLEMMKAENCEPAWRDGFARIMAGLELAKAAPYAGARRKRIAVIVPVGYRGGSLRGAKLLAQALHEGSRQAGEDADIVLAHLDDDTIYAADEWKDLHPGISRRAYTWRHLNAAAARRAMCYAGYDGTAAHDGYIVPEDGMRQFADCDLWITISDRLQYPLLPLRPHICMIYDYLQRYETILPHGADQPYLNAARAAARVLVTTRFTESDALNYAGIEPFRLRRVPILAPSFDASPATAAKQAERPYFLWTTNAAPHKNHLNALLALAEYYEVLDGQLDCRVTGVNTHRLLQMDVPHLKQAAAAARGCATLDERLHWMGELPDGHYRRMLAGAAFLWHPARIDNGTFSVIEAAHLGVPSLSSDYPPMREIDAQFGLNLGWMDAHDPRGMARALKRMEREANGLRAGLPAKETLDMQSVTRLAGHYWKAVRACL
ncbi:MAG: glycosytransferase [Alphaproteobacteria bacterium]